VPGLLRSLIQQICEADKTLPADIKKLYDDNKLHSPTSNIQDLKKLLASVSRSQGVRYIVIDALDECTEREELLRVLSALVSMNDASLRILVTSRYEMDIKKELKDIVTDSISIEGLHVTRDISVYVRNQVASDSKLKKWPDDLKMRIETTLVTRAQGMFVGHYPIYKSIAKLHAPGSAGSSVKSASSRSAPRSRT
jgi:hypothetical protein